MDVHSEESSGNDDAQDGAGHEERVDRDVDLCVLDQQQCAVFGRVPAKFGEGNTCTYEKFNRKLGCLYKIIKNDDSCECVYLYCW